MTRRRQIQRQPVFDDIITCYNPKRDGPLEQYLMKHDGSFSFPLFRGVSWYWKLKEGGFFTPGFSVIRIMYHLGNDEHYGVREDYRLEGILAGSSPGQKGVYPPRKLLTKKGASWEPHRITLDPESRELNKPSRTALIKREKMKNVGKK